MTKPNHTKSYLDIRILALLWFLPLAIYGTIVGKWSLSGDEFYTLVDSSKAIGELLSYERKPLYYLVCHLLLQFDLGLPVETVVRIPAMIAASLVAPVFYGMLATRSFSKFAFLAALIAMVNPWLLQMSQFARFYSLAFLFTSISALAGHRWLDSSNSKAKRKWLSVFFIAGVLAGLSHIPAILILPGGGIGMFLATFRANPRVATKFLRSYGLALGIGFLACSAIGVFVLKDVLHLWYTSEHGNFGGYDVKSILVSLALFGGLSTWALAFLPLMRVPTSWTSSDLYWIATVSFCSLPLLALVGMGGGVAANYLMFCLPGVFVLAARHWGEIDARLPTWGFRFAVGCGLFAFNLPYLMSAISDGDHFDYRGIASEIEAMDLENPIIVSSAHQLLDMYLDQESELLELKTFENGVPRARIEEAIKMAHEQQRPLLLVVREDRNELSNDDQDWLYPRFALVSTVYKPRYDHRRHRMAAYRYRPDPQLTVPHVCEKTENIRPAADAVAIPEVSTAP